MCKVMRGFLSYTGFEGVHNREENEKEILLYLDFLDVN